MPQWFYLYRQWLLRELQLRFRNSALGTAWLILQPLAQIVLFTLVFYEFFQVRWPMGDGTIAEYGLQVFLGLTLFSFVAEIINRTPGSVSGYPFLITKVRFPLLLLPAVVVGASAVQLALSLVIGLVFALWREVHWQVLLLPVALLPLMVYALALAWFLGAAGVYLRDIGHLAPSVSSLLLFLSPIFYPASKIPDHMQWLIHWNPLAWTLEAVRGLLMHGQSLPWSAWSVHAAVAVVGLVVARWFFVRIQPGFADVL